MSFITVQNLSSLSYPNLLCCELSEEYLNGSYLFIIPQSSSNLIEKAKCLNLQQSFPIVCYDQGNMVNASRAYWVLKAVGYTKVSVLYGGLKACRDYKIKLNSIPPADPPITSQLLDFNFSLVMTKLDFMKLSTAQYHLVYANNLSNCIYERVKELSKNKVQEFLDSIGFKDVFGPSQIIFGELSPLLGLLLEYLLDEEVCIVLEDIDVNGTRTSYKSLNNSAAFFSLTESEAEDASYPSPVHYQVFPSVSKNSMEIEDRIETCSCRKCILM
jgi:Rhodanese-like domain